MDKNKINKYLTICQDLGPVRRHADGSICKAGSPDTCPFNKKIENAEASIGNSKGDEGGVDYNEKAPQERAEFNKWIKAHDIETDAYKNGLDHDEFFEPVVNEAFKEIRKDPFSMVEGDNYQEAIESIRDYIEHKIQNAAENDVNWGSQNPMTGNYDHPTFKRRDQIYDI